MSNRKEIHERVLNATSKEELATAYDEWAEEYDHDLINELGYAALFTATKLLKQYQDDPNSYILDAGCGTGLVGKSLQELGFKKIDGLDYSKVMLKKAQEKQLYQQLSQGDLTDSLDIPTNTYDAVISVGTFTCGHVGPEAFDELTRIIKPGGYICFTVRGEAWDEDESYRKKIDALQKNNIWQPLEEKTTTYLEKEGSLGKVCLCQITN